MVALYYTIAFSIYRHLRVSVIANAHASHGDKYTRTHAQTYTHSHAHIQKPVLHHLTEEVVNKWFRSDLPNEVQGVSGVTDCSFLIRPQKLGVELMLRMLAYNDDNGYTDGHACQHSHRHT